MAFGSPLDPLELDEVERFALRQQAARAVPRRVYVGRYDVRLASQPERQPPIVEIIFSDLPWLGDAPNSLVRDHENRTPRSRGLEQSVRDRGRTFSDRKDRREPRWDGDWFNVEVDVTSFVEWLQLSIASERRKQLDRKLSRRLFEYPFWSIETALSWIAIRDADRLQDNLLGPWRAGRPDENVESQPEIRLLRALRDGRLKARENARVLPSSHWANSVAMMGDFSPASQSVRLAREDVLRLFPETMTHSCLDVRARRQARIDRVVQEMRTTRQWISCAEIAERSARQLTGAVEREHHRPFVRLEKTFAAGGFQSRGKSQLCLLTPDTSVVRLICKPVERTVDTEEPIFPKALAPDFLEHCWLPTEIARRWLKKHEFDWLEKLEVISRIEMPPSETKASKKVGRPSDRELYLREYERRRGTNKLSGDLKKISMSIEDWPRLTPRLSIRFHPQPLVT
jgi:hypothetical protein